MEMSSARSEVQDTAYCTTEFLEDLDYIWTMCQAFTFFGLNIFL